MRNEPSQEWKIRCDLAAAYRLIAHFGMDDLISTHLSARLPGKGHRFLINPYGMMFDEITASSLAVVDPERYMVEEQETSNINNAGFTIHSAVHMSRHDAQCVMHTHTLAGMAVAAQEEGLLPLNQMSMIFHGRIAYHEYEGPVLNLDERARLVCDLGDKDAMILRHHGLLTVGRTVPEAFLNMYWLDRACQIQVAATQGGRRVALPSNAVAAHTAEQSKDYSKGWRPWAALKRRLDRISPNYAT
ncbi:class II aldolase/adducin family protein [Bradyrhizobium sp. ISRA443]|uniref:class II aldolase/adducin family protein n=1 Tax=unclassified Bradyrhizobium TaxID=2631580 RepID=UPI0024786053|nr:MULTISPECIES: class II aldolase/adducin family protein [unclassified Bradyrhizobium]WGR93395.1 class II aldolase/adducin family protein [Bradyrhizobium sp. ISRA435]WGR97934.1 class II aldolase/adducin family protein [Bradyrhizobium sp. ISRA436]WGS04824.1 class II aldolase/adducin family protein [Bradyrhizobium sp. ISRA437]WGS11705.1 class II aldolase/adducin family protein [Bradyrhizobium sp. ISRA443]